MNCQLFAQERLMHTPMYMYFISKIRLYCNFDGKFQAGDLQQCVSTTFAITVFLQYMVNHDSFLGECPTVDSIRRNGSFFIQAMRSSDCSCCLAPTLLPGFHASKRYDTCSSLTNFTATLSNIFQPMQVIYSGKLASLVIIRVLYIHNISRMKWKPLRWQKK